MKYICQENKVYRMKYKEKKTTQRQWHRLVTRKLEQECKEIFQTRDKIDSITSISVREQYL